MALPSCSRPTRRTAARTINALMTATYWEIGRRIVEFEQGGEKRAEYGEGLMACLADDLTARFGRGFSRQNLQRFRLFYLSQPAEKICSTLSSKLTGGIASTPSNELGEATIVQTLSAKSKMAKIRPTPSDISQAPFGKYSLFALSDLARAFPLPWSTDLEEALLRHLENFLLELGGDFAFIDRQRRLRVGGEWYRIDLLFFHRKLRCLVVIDLKVGKFTHADAGQMHLYLNYAREHWTQADENPPVGLILCAEKDDAIAKYALEGLPNKVLAREYKLAFPNEKRLAAEIEKTRELLERRSRK